MNNQLSVIWSYERTCVVVYTEFYWILNTQFYVWSGLMTSFYKKALFCETFLVNLKSETWLKMSWQKFYVEIINNKQILENETKLELEQDF